MSPEDMVKRLCVYKNSSSGIYKGIIKAHFPKWEGWKVLELGEDPEDLVIDFYIEHYYDSLKLYECHNPYIAYTLLNFATLHGKKKALQKLTQVAGLDSIMMFNSLGIVGEYNLLLEILEFYEFIGNKDTSWVIKVYKQLD
jgi:hypothetical protein